jgi:hypothetical protein
MEGTIYGNRLPRRTQVKKSLETTVIGDLSAFGKYTPTIKLRETVFYETLVAVC